MERCCEGGLPNRPNSGKCWWTFNLRGLPKTSVWESKFQKCTRYLPAVAGPLDLSHNCGCTYLTDTVEKNSKVKKKKNSGRSRTEVNCQQEGTALCSSLLQRSEEQVWESREMLYIFHEFLLKLQVTQAAIR